MRRRILTVALTLCGAALGPATLLAQVPLPEGRPVDPALRFEVASIRPYTDAGPTRVQLQPPARLNVTGASVRTLLQNAFRVRGDEVIGLPDWSDANRYSIAAIGPDGAPITAIPTMLGNLLVDRFSLSTHRETREIQRFDLVLARDDGKLGTALRPTSAVCQTAIEQGGRPAPPPPVGADAAPCGTMQAGVGLARATGVTIGRLVQLLSQVSGRTVNDLTGLTGLYDFTLKFNPVVDAPADSDLPNLFTALQEQLGLRLASQRGLAEVIVVDRIERPTAD